MRSRKKENFFLWKKEERKLPFLKETRSAMVTWAPLLPGTRQDNLCFLGIITPAIGQEKQPCGHPFCAGQAVWFYLGACGGRGWRNGVKNWWLVPQNWQHPWTAPSQLWPASDWPSLGGSTVYKGHEYSQNQLHQRKWNWQTLPKHLLKNFMNLL